MTNPTNRAARVPLHPEAFSHDLRPRAKRPRTLDRDHLKFIRSLPCLVCGSRRNIHAAHIRTGSPGYGKRRTGLGERPDDRWSLPICGDDHVYGTNAQHALGEAVFWHAHGIDPFVVALALFAASGDEDAAELIIKEARRG